MRSTDLALNAKKLEPEAVWLVPEGAVVAEGVGKVSTGGVGIGVSLINDEFAKKLGIPVIADCDVVGFGTLNRFEGCDGAPNNVEVDVGLLSDAEDGFERGAGAEAGFSETAGFPKLKGSDVNGGSLAVSNSAERSGPAVCRNRAVSMLCNYTNPTNELTSLAKENPTGSANSCGTGSTLAVSPIASSPSSS